MTIFHLTSPDDALPGGKKRMSLFSFGLSTSIATKPAAPPPISTSPGTSGVLSKKLGFSPTTGRNSQLGSPVCLPVLETDSLSSKPDSNIFERSVQDSSEVKQEDFIPPALDASAQILSDKDTNLDDIEMVYLSRRNSSVIGLNMALGRAYTPLRKNSVYLMSQLNQGANAASQSSLHQPQSPVSPPKLSSLRSSVSFYSYADMINSDEYARRPSVMHSYSHGVVPTVGRKMSVASSHSATSNAGAPLHFGKLSRKVTLALSTLAHLQSQLSKQLARDRVTTGAPQRSPSRLGEAETRNLNKFLISPESSDSEDQEVYYPATLNLLLGRQKSVSSAQSQAESENLILTSVGDCIRQCTTEISGH